jgi:thermopsin
MGIGDFGVSPYGAYALSTEDVLGQVAWNGVQFDNVSLGSDANDASLQLNVILTFAHNGEQYVYWIQDVVFFETANPTNPGVEFIDNVWNFSAPGSSMSNSTIEGNGTVYSSSGGAFYEDDASASLPGNEVNLGSPGTLQLLVESGVDGANQPVVAFGYIDSKSSGLQIYDNVAFQFASLGGDDFDENFLIDGFQTTPIGAFYDAELTVGGPGSGSYTGTVSGSQFNMSLFEYNGNNYQAPLNTLNFGSDTAESVYNTSSVGAYSSAAGTLSAALSYNTSQGPNAEPDPLYNQTEVGVLNVTDASLSSGVVVVGGQEYYSFEGGQALLTLGPGTYEIQVGATLGTVTSWGDCVVGAGTYDVVTSTSHCASEAAGVLINSFWSEFSPVSVGETTDIYVGTMVDGTASYAYSGLPTGCTSTNSLVLACTPTGAGFYNITVQVTDGSSFAEAVLSLQVVGSVTPLTVSISASPNPVVVDSSVTFTTTVSGGDPPYNGTYSGLPPGCSSEDAPTVTCSPTATGDYSVEVTITDSASATQSATVSLDVVSQGGGSPLSVQITVNPNPVTVDQSMTVTVTASGGTAPYSYTYSGLPGGCTAPASTVSSFACTPDATGTFTVGVSVTDGADSTQSQTASLSVQQGSSGSSGAGGAAGLPISLTDLLLIIVLIVAVLVVVAVAMRRRPPAQTYPATQYPGAYPGGPPPAGWTGPPPGSYGPMTPGPAAPVYTPPTSPPAAS